MHQTAITRNQHWLLTYTAVCIDEAVNKGGPLTDV